MNTAQMELGFDGVSVNPSPRSSRPGSRAAHHWWFERMRQIVDRAFDWEPAPPPRPEQTWFTDSHREVSATQPAGKNAAVRDAEEHQVCA